MKIQVTNKNTYTGQFEDWTEPIKREFVADKNLIVTHKSFDFIQEFEIGIMTCVNTEIDSEEYLDSLDRDFVLNNYELKKDIVNEEYLYKMIIPAGTKIMEFVSGEYRLYINETIKIELIGKMGNMKIVDDSYDSEMYGGKTIKVFTEKL